MRITHLLPFALAAALPAQRHKVIPPTAFDVDANASSYAPFLYSGGSRTQHLIDGAQIGASTAVLQEFAFRREKGGTAFPGKTIPNYSVTIGHAATTPGTMSTVFASNRKGAQTSVFSGSYNLPAQKAAPIVGDFNIVFKLTRPFIYQRGVGDLLIEFSEKGNATRKFDYRLDAHRASVSGGTASTLGVNGPFKSGEKYSFVCSSADTLRPGGSISVQAAGLSRRYPAAVAYGFSSVVFGSIPLPFDLKVIGAPGNFAYISLDLVSPLALKQVGSSWTGGITGPIPNSKALSGLTVFAQALFVDASSNAAGVVWSNGVAMMIGGRPPSQTLMESNSSKASGFFLFGRNVGGPVIRLRGSLR